MKLLASYPDAAELARDLLAEELEAYEPDVEVTTKPVRGWRPETSPEYLQVAWDGTPFVKHPVVAHATIRLVAWALTAERAKALVATAQGLLLAHAGGSGIARIGALTGTLPSQDPETKAELAAVTLRVTVRSQEIPEGS